MNRYLFFTLLISFFTCDAQKNNALQINRGMMLSKAPYAAFVNSSYGGDTHYDSYELSQPMLSSFWQFGYQRDIFRHWKLGLRFRALREGARSTFQQPKPKPNYRFGGRAIYGNIFTFETGLTIGYFHRLNKFLFLEVGFAPSITLVEFFQRRDEYLNREMGTASSTYSFLGSGNDVATQNELRRYINLLKIGGFKGVGHIFTTVHIDTKYPWLAFQLTGEFGGSTNLLSRNERGLKLVIPYTKVWKGMIHFGTSIKF